jgi:hypothetical protein
MREGPGLDEPIRPEAACHCSGLLPLAGRSYIAAQ